ncbi:NAD(P)/FAD-dependent oxidoreductase [Desulfosporosinus meridiei]|uniref:Thioredoxin reductase n=1 Tax=Desulfosporosinus meridiei (strain ATCC BAA-275 / DSM 13257 / KCTC 12902 / NCIMB 13706 / S10) TaxID=768704 RepID=J7ITE2_DESMD|nr:FAD-dependent oxidoreductase [Desulfosporosinus meridiei]AFQ44975.1 thioredoxin reductase [Desulfosporosinus meridiei DSM 13257]
MKEIEVLIIGGGPAGLSAASAAANLGASVLVLERDDLPGGQLVKQTHKFFGSKKQYAGDRGFQIGSLLIEQCKTSSRVEVWTNTTALGIYEDGVVTAESQDEHVKIKPKKIIVATGASEKMIAFPNNDLPGIYGAGAVQTLMNVHGIVPGQRVLMIGAGNIGLIVSYQLMQAGVEIAAIIEAAPTIGGYLVHASKIRRAGVPILTSHTITEAYGQESVEGAVICKLDENWQPIQGTEQDLKVDVICLAVGLSPLTELCFQADCRMKYVPELSGHVPIRNEYLETTRPGLYVAGDVSGVEEASSAMVEGRLAGVSAAYSLGYGNDAAPKLQEEALAELNELRSGPAGHKTMTGIMKLMDKGEAIC